MLLLIGRTLGKSTIAILDLLMSIVLIVIFAFALNILGLNELAG